MIETYRMLGREHEADLIREAERIERAEGGRARRRTSRHAMLLFVPVIVLVGLLLLVALTASEPAWATNDLNARFPVVEVGSPCTSEPVLIESVVHIVVGEGEAYFRFHANEVGLGRTESGTLYVGNNTFRSSFQNRGPTVAFTELFHLNIIRQGEELSQDDFTLHGVLHVTETPTGLTAEVDNLQVSCR